MKKRKSVLVVAILGLLCAALMAGCSEPQEKEIFSGNDNGDYRAYYDKGMQPGAKVHEYVNKNGENVVEWENPDGSGGGEVELD